MHSFEESLKHVSITAAYFRDKMGFAIDFLYGDPAFHGAVSRDAVSLHLRYVDDPPFARAAAKEEQLICATIETNDVTALYEDMAVRGADIAQALIDQPWGGTDFHVRDPDGNVVSFVT